MNAFERYEEPNPSFPFPHTTDNNDPPTLYPENAIGSTHLGRLAEAAYQLPHAGAVAASPPPDTLASELDIVAYLRKSAGLLDPAIMAKALNVTEETLAMWRCKRRGPPFVKLGKQVFYLLSKFPEWVIEETDRQLIEREA